MDSSWVCYENYHTLNYLKKKYLEIFIHNKSTKNKNNDQIKVKDSETQIKLIIFVVIMNKVLYLQLKATLEQIKKLELVWLQLVLVAQMY